MQLLGSPRCELSVQEGANLGGSHVEQLRKGAGTVAVPGQGRLQSIEVRGQHVVDDLRGDWMCADFVPGLEGQSQVLLDLQRRRERPGQALDGLVGENLGAIILGALPEQPRDVGLDPTVLSPAAISAVGKRLRRSFRPVTLSDRVSRTGFTRSKAPFPSRCRQCRETDDFRQAAPMRARGQSGG
jgi:hypothetical protein